MSRRPNIGVTAATEMVSYGVWENIPAIISPARYIEAVQRAGLMIAGMFSQTP